MAQLWRKCSFSKGAGAGPVTYSVAYLMPPHQTPGLPGPAGKGPGGDAFPASERQLCRPPACCRGLSGTATVCWEALGSLALPTPMPFNFLLSGHLTFMFRSIFMLLFQCPVLDIKDINRDLGQDLPSQRCLYLSLSLHTPAPGPLRLLFSFPTTSFFFLYWFLPEHMVKSLLSSTIK